MAPKAPGLKLLFNLKDGFTLLAALIKGVVATVGADPVRSLRGAAAGAGVKCRNRMRQV
jgi:hypothetical protein